MILEHLKDRLEEELLQRELRPGETAVDFIRRWAPPPGTVDPTVDDGSFAAVDYETYYKNKVCSVKELGPQAYTRHPDFYAYLVSIVSADYTYVGPPEKADWSRIRNKVWIAHNAAFDAAVHRWCVGTWPRNVLTNVHGWVDTAQLSTYLRAGRTLQQAAKSLLDVEMSKEARDSMSGKHWRNLSPEQQQAMCDYALKDAQTTYDIWIRYHKQWPALERWLGQHTLHLHDRGVRIDRDKLDDGLRLLAQRKWDAEQLIPWAVDDEDDGDEDDEEKVVASSAKFVAHCRAHNVEPPASTASKDPEFQAWRRRVGDFGKFADALIQWRKCNRLLRLLQTMKARTHVGNGMMPVSLRYGGGHTMRWSGDGGFSVQNLSKSDELGVDLRSLFVPRPGYKFVIADMSQIEPRCLAWLAGDWEFLKLVAQGMSPYEAHARVSMGWTGGVLKKENLILYSLSKARILALGYGAGWQKFIFMATMYLVGKDGTVDQESFDKIFRAPVSQETREEFVGFLEWSKKKRKDTLLDEFNAMSELDQRVWVNAYAQVNDFRASNPKLSNKDEGAGPLGLWERLNSAIPASRKETLRLVLPNGYAIEYYDVEFWGNMGWTGKAEKGGYRKRLWKGLLVENVVQSVARFVFAEGIKRLEDAGYPVVFHVHDEVIVEVPADAGPDTVKKVEHLLAQAPAWMPGLPVAAEGFFADHYKK